MSYQHYWIASKAPQVEYGSENPPYFVQDKTKFPKEPHHVFDEVAHSRPAWCCVGKLGSYVVGSIYSLACTE